MRMESADKEDVSREAALAKVRRIVVHGGLAHVDDIMACAIAYAFGVPHDAQIERRNPAPDELAAVTTLVLDVGGDDRGALALGRFRKPILQENDFNNFFVALIRIYI